MIKGWLIAFNFHEKLTPSIPKGVSFRDDTQGKTTKLVVTRLSEPSEGLLRTLPS
jgi:hypothetical protein